MAKIKVAAPAKINMTLKVDKVRPDGFHPIDSIMCAIDLFDYIYIETVPCSFGGHGVINILSNSSEIPNNSSNIAYKAAAAFRDAVCNSVCNKENINIYIEKNIPVAAGLAGGSTDAAAVVFGLNKIYNYPLNEHKINQILISLGSDLNFCYYGGAKRCKGRGEVLFDVENEDEYKNMPITLIKPKNLKISAKEAYQRFDELDETVSNLPNDLEFALLSHHREVEFLHDLGFQMSGSGPTFFCKSAFLESGIKEKLGNDYLIIENLKTVHYGVSADFV